MANVIGTEIFKKHTVEKQSDRARVSFIEDNYRVTVFKPFSDNFISQLTNRFLNYKLGFEGKAIYYCLS